MNAASLSCRSRRSYADLDARLNSVVYPLVQWLRRKSQVRKSREHWWPHRRRETRDTGLLWRDLALREDSQCQLPTDPANFAISKMNTAGSRSLDLTLGLEKLDFDLFAVS